MKQLFQRDFFEGNEEPKRFVEPKSEDDDGFSIENRCPRDLADFINEKGGLKLMGARTKLDRFLNDMKAQIFISKVFDAGVEGVEADNDLAERIRSIAASCLTGADRSLANAISLVCNRDYRTLAVIKKRSWQELGLDEPQLTVEERAEGTGIPLEEYRKIEALEAKLNQPEEKKGGEQSE